MNGHPCACGTGSGSALCQCTDMATHTFECVALDCWRVLPSCECKHCGTKRGVHDELAPAPQPPANATVKCARKDCGRERHEMPAHGYGPGAHDFIPPADAAPKLPSWCGNENHTHEPHTDNGNCYERPRAPEANAQRGPYRTVADAAPTVRDSLTGQAHPALTLADIAASPPVTGDGDVALVREIAEWWGAEIPLRRPTVDEIQLAERAYAAGLARGRELGAPKASPGDEEAAREIAHRMLAGVHECKNGRHGEVCEKTTAGLLKALGHGRALGARDAIELIRAAGQLGEMDMGYAEILIDAIARRAGRGTP